MIKGNWFKYSSWNSLFMVEISDFCKTQKKMKDISCLHGRAVSTKPGHQVFWGINLLKTQGLEHNTQNVRIGEIIFPSFWNTISQVVNISAYDSCAMSLLVGKKVCGVSGCWFCDWCNLVIDSYVYPDICCCLVGVSASQPLILLI